MSREMLETVLIALMLIVGALWIMIGEVTAGAVFMVGGVFYDRGTP